MHGMQEVTGSIPVISTRTKSTTQKCVVLFYIIKCVWSTPQSATNVKIIIPLIMASAHATILNRPLHRGQAAKTFTVLPPAKFRLDICGKLWYNAFWNCGYSTSASISAFQAEEVGSIPITRSKKTWTLNGSGLFFLHGGRRTCCKPAAEMLQ